MGRVRIDQLLVDKGLFESRSQARAAIEAGRVSVGGAPVGKPGQLVEPGADLTAEPAWPWVGRAALKLVHALDLWPVPVEGRVVLDVGASTGGFTEVCLARGAARVYAVDVGRGQLHPRLACDPRVVNLEGTDARKLDPGLVPEPPQLVVCDASFISLAKVLAVPLSLASDQADLVALVKPQFEVGPQRVGKGGLVRDPQARAEAVDAAVKWLGTQGWRVRGETPSPITGAEGAVEHLLWARRGEPPP